MVAPLMPLVLDVERAYTEARDDPAFAREMGYYFSHYVGRPSPLYLARRLTDHLGGAKIYFNREDMNNKGARKIRDFLEAAAGL